MGRCKRGWQNVVQVVPIGQWLEGGRVRRSQRFCAEFEISGFVSSVDSLCLRISLPRHLFFFSPSPEPSPDPTIWRTLICTKLNLLFSIIFLKSSSHFSYKTNAFRLPSTLQLPYFPHFTAHVLHYLTDHAQSPQSAATVQATVPACCRRRLRLVRYSLAAARKRASTPL